MTELSGDVALVTGATRGIGRGIAEGLAAEGATVAVNHLPGPDGAAAGMSVADAIENAGGSARPVPGDVTDAESISDMVEDVESQEGTVDILVNNAGISSTAPLHKMSVEMWDKMMHVNLRGVFLSTRYALPGMLERSSGKIINIASQMGFKGASGAVHYSASKGGVIAFTRALAREVAPDINVNAIAPGPVMTDMLRSSTTEAELEKQRKGLPLKRIGSVEDIVPTAVFLAGSGSDYYSGQVLSPDGGDVMH